ncbi:MAG: AAA family ATPase [Oceanospirillaceae bacterium]
MSDIKIDQPDLMVSVRDVFSINSMLKVPAFSLRDEHVPEIDPDYVFNPEVTLAILAGFSNNRRVMVQGLHGTGKSTHIEQIAARLNWPCVRINLDGHISRLDLVGKDTIVVRDNQQITEFQEGILPWALRRPTALIFDEFDAGRPEVMFVIQRILERDGKFTLLDQNEVITPHNQFRLFATANTIGLGNSTGLYHGTQMVNQAQMDRWDIVTNLSYLPCEDEVKIIQGKVKSQDKPINVETIRSMIAVADMTRKSFAAGDISTLMSPRTVISWAENIGIFDNAAVAFKLSFLNKCDEAERPIIAEFFQRCFDLELSESWADTANQVMADGRH